MRESLSPSELAKGVLEGDRSALGRSISLVESRLEAHRSLAIDLLDLLPPSELRTLRIGVTGAPGAGKSSFIERVGIELCRERGEKVAVLAVDPSSPESGGSILGDKTRMEELSREPRAFIRPSPSSGSLGGIARRTAEAIRLCEAAGYRYIFIETVGVGQSEFKVRELCDIVTLLLVTGSGDQLQALKRGIMETADIIAINKADGENKRAARILALEVAQAIRITEARSDFIKVMTVSSLPQKDSEPSPISEYLETLHSLWNRSLADGRFEQKRKAQVQERIIEEACEQMAEEFERWVRSSAQGVTELGSLRERQKQIEHWKREFRREAGPSSETSGD